MFGGRRKEQGYSTDRVRLPFGRILGMVMSLENSQNNISIQDHIDRICQSLSSLVEDEPWLMSPYTECLHFAGKSARSLVKPF